ncbi:hypothetical protein HanXRQr2_Chr04g0175411 [Helianthus annuus]|uniref:Uncharacterized protein n=1 Tax=Helianthus annuus TaxID=4232 RepID=A0A9K3J9L4_HELAN|nr:hypothetical protein HanXRQr2_Chr04g0175411 [Helianthus annuus]KAJ0589696.1 hypothetical protein HanIR_Chr04g0189171 [Helianthus annuus]KAJ0597637.1 hypothetical protein HanHA89_Chr04g0156861 [Helianthus annuus]
MTELLNQYDGEVTELYDFISELLLTKLSFLPEGVAWVVRPVHQSPELEKVVADLTSCVNIIGVNDMIKQGYHVAKTTDKLVTEVPGYDKDSKNALDAAIKAFDKFNISVLHKVSDLVNGPLSKIKGKSHLPILDDSL